MKNCTSDPHDALKSLLGSQSNLTVLHISNSPLTRLPSEVCLLTQLTILAVPNNRLETLPWECLRNLRHLHHIDASHNRIKQLENGSFYNTHLGHLILHHNQISVIGVDVFTRPEALQGLTTIDISWNRLKSLDPWPIMLMNGTRTISLDNNQISHFTNFIGWKFKCPKNRLPTKITLRSNRISHIMDMLSGWNLTADPDVLCLLSGQFFSIELQVNKFMCDCIDFDIYSLLYRVNLSSYAEHLLCDTPQHLHMRKITSIPLDQFTCQYTYKDGCPDQCHCTGQPAHFNMSILCDKSKLATMPEKLPKSSLVHYHYYLNFIDNNMTKLTYRVYFNQTKRALFTRNMIGYIGLDVFNALKNAEMVALDYNKLKYLPKNIATVNMTSVKDIRLANNKWVCDCHAKETRRWLIRMQAVISDKERIVCQTPSRLLGSNLLLISEDNLICGSTVNKSALTYSTTLGMLAGVCILFILLLTMLVSTKRVWLFKTFHWHPLDSDECEGESKEFDVFVSYAHEDADYVEDNLIPGLQRRTYKIVYHRIGLLPGKYIHTQIEECVLRSKRTLIVCSNDFLRSECCLWDLTVALEQDGKNNTHRVLAIRYEDVQAGFLDPILQTFFTQCIHLQPGSKCFWDNLEYVLPIKTLGAINDDPHDVTTSWHAGLDAGAHPACYDDGQTLDDNIPDEDRARLLAEN